MLNENTICHKVNNSIEEIEQAIKTGKVNLVKLARRLHSIRKDAQRMENGLKNRKKVMIKANLEKMYQESKKKRLKPEGINTISNTEKHTKKKINFEVTIKEQGKLVYKNKVHAGVVCLVEKIRDIDEFGVVDGQTQKFIFGHPLSYWFAFDQLKQGIEAKNVAVMAAIKSAILKRKFVDPEVKKQIINSMR